MSARLSPATPPHPPKVEAALARLTPPGQAPLALFTTLARDPRLLQRLLGGGLLDEGRVTVRQREIVIHRTCARAGAAYEWGVHAALFAPAAGLDDAALSATLHESAEAACWSAEERLLIRLCDEAHERADVSDALWAELAAAFAPEALIELLMLCGYYRSVSLLTNALRLAPEPFARSLSPSPAS